MAKTALPTIDAFGLLRVATATPTLRVADPEHNLEQVLKLVRQADREEVALTVFPELTLSGWSIGDLVQQDVLLSACRDALIALKRASVRFNTTVIVGLPLVVDDGTYNVGAVVGQGKIHGIVPKTHLPNYQEFYEQRWYRSATDLAVGEVEIDDEAVPVGPDLLFADRTRPDAVIGVELCEDLWAPIPPSSHQTVAGATIVVNLSASNEVVGKAGYRHALVEQQSARGHAAYLYASAGVHESTTDLVFGGHALICENGITLGETERFGRENELLVRDLDLDHLALDRRRSTTFAETDVYEFDRIPIELAPGAVTTVRPVDPHPFVPADPATRDERAAEIFAIQAAGLAKRLDFSGIDRPVIGVSGGLDSTLALLVCVEACRLRGKSPKLVEAITLPGPATGKRTKSQAHRLAEALGITLEEISIGPGTVRQLKDIGHDGVTQDVTYENVQARYRTMILMNRSNQRNGLVVGTGDLSELALGWNTFSGDQISHYNVNAGLPKTLVRHVVEWASRQPQFADARKTLADILDTPISPELTGTGEDEALQETETIIGPYELHDFFLYHFVRWGSRPAKILWLAERAFDDRYTGRELQRWLTVFVTRFFKNQWKRSVMPDGPKVGSVTLSPRGDWRMPSDAEVTAWLRDLEQTASATRAARRNAPKKTKRSPSKRGPA